MSEALLGSEPLQVDRAERYRGARPRWAGTGESLLRPQLQEREEAAHSLDHDPEEAESQAESL